MNNGYLIHYLYIYSEFSFAWNTQFAMFMEMQCFSASLGRGGYAFKTEVFIFSKTGLSISNWKIIFKGFCLTSEDSIGGGSGIDEDKIFFFLLNFHNICNRETTSIFVPGLCLLIPVTFFLSGLPRL